MFLFNVILFVFRIFYVFRPVVLKFAPNVFKSRVLSNSDLHRVADFFHVFESYGFECSFQASDFIENQFHIYYSTGFDVVNSPIDFKQVYGYNYILFIRLHFMLYFNCNFDISRLKKVYDDQFHQPFEWEYIGDFSHHEVCVGCIECSSNIRGFKLN